VVDAMQSAGRNDAGVSKQGEKEDKSRREDCGEVAADVSTQNPKMSRHASWGVYSTLYLTTCVTTTSYRIDWSNQLDGCGHFFGHILAAKLDS